MTIHIAPVKDNAFVELTGTYTTSDTTLTLKSGHGDRLPQPNIDGGSFTMHFFKSDKAHSAAARYATPLVYEKLTVTARTGDTLTVTRSASPVALDETYIGVRMLDQTDYDAIDGRLISDGTSDRIPKYTATSRVGNSNITDDGSVVSTTVDFQAPTVITSTSPFYDVTHPDNGLVGDGATDNYSAMLALATKVNGAGGGTIYFPPGTYLIDQAVLSTNSNSFITFLNCNGLRVVGYGAVISSKGDFERTDTSDSSIGFCRFKGCTNVSIEGLELDGNVDQMTRNPTDLTEGNSYGIHLAGCKRVTIKDVHSHHWATDGIHMTVNSDPALDESNRDVTIMSSRFDFNARLGMGIINVRGLTCISCSASDVGKAAGTYGSHGPQSSWNIEPIRTQEGVDVDIECGEITLIDCEFFNSARVGIISHSNIRGTSVLNCRHRIEGTSSDTNAALYRGERTVIQGCEYDLTARNAHLKAYLNAPDTEESVSFRDNRVLVDFETHGMFSTNNGRLIVEGNSFISQATQEITNNIVNIQNTKAIFKDNYTFVPTAGYGAGSGAKTVAIVEVELAAHNRWDTDHDGSGGDYFAVVYTSADQAFNERSLNANSGFRLSGGSAGESEWAAGSIMAHFGDLATRNIFRIVREQTAEPSSPVNGMIVRADGITWDPLSKSIGKDYLVFYNNSAWHDLGFGLISGLTNGNLLKKSTDHRFADSILSESGGVLTAAGDLKIDNFTRHSDYTELTISAGSITVTGDRHSVDTEADASTDDLDTISATGADGARLVLKAANDARTVVVKNAVGNIFLAGTDFSLDNTNDRIFLERDGTNWYEISRASNGA